MSLSRNPNGRPARQVPEGTRWCGACQEAQPIEDFTGRERTCREAKYYAHIRRTYGVSKQSYLEQVSWQGGMCMCCKIRPCAYVDHNHKTGSIRGILCPTCNTAVGYVESHPGLVDQVEEYLRRFEYQEWARTP